MEARVLQDLKLMPGESVLEIGTGSGFLAACLAQLAAEVTTLEIFADVSERAGRVLSRLAVPNVRLEVGDVFQAFPDGGYDAVALTGSLPVYDPRFEGLLSPGGRLFVIVGQAPVMEALLVTRVGSEGLTRESLFETVVPALIHAPVPSAFEW